MHFHLIKTLIILFFTIQSLSISAIEKDQFERISSLQAGYSAEKLKLLEKQLKASGSSSMMLLYDGKVFFEWGDIYQKHLIHSIRKAMLNSLMGIAIDKGQISLNSTLKELNINKIQPELNQEELNATVAMILQSRSGIYLNATAESAWMKSQKPKRGQFKPGEHYYYNNWDFNLAGYIFEQQTGQKIFEAFNQNIAKPLGMLQFDGKYTRINGDDKMAYTDGFYQFELAHSPFPAYHFRMSAHDMALYGQLYLNQGKWLGEQLIPADWIKQSTQIASVENEKYGLGYGMLWKVLVPDKNQQRNSFYHTGNAVHMLGVYPDLKLVMVHRVDTESEYRFKTDDLYAIISLMHGARIN